MKRQLYFLLPFLLMAIRGLSQTSDDNYPAWEHPIYKKAKAFSKDVIAFSKSDTTLFIATCVIDKPTKKIYWFDCYGFFFDALPISDNGIEGITKKWVSPFAYYDTIIVSYIRTIDKAKKNLQENGTKAKFTAYEKQLLQIDDTIKFPSTLRKLMNLDEQKLSVEMRLANFHSINPKYIDKDSIYSKSLDYKYGTMTVSYKPDTIATFYNCIAIQPVYKAILNKKESTIDYYNRRGQFIDEIQLNTKKIHFIIDEKIDVFALYRGWLEVQRKNLLDAIKTQMKITNITASSDNKAILQVQTVNLHIINFKINYLTNADFRFIQQNLRQEYQSVFAPPSPTFGTIYTETRGNKYYELTDPKGNVMAVITDKKMQHTSDGVTVDYYTADVVSATDYSSFGSPLPGRNYHSDAYPYGFNGKRNDGETGYQDYGYRIYDPAIGRFLSVDPLKKKYPYYSPYQFAGNNPIKYVDLDGLEPANNPKTPGTNENRAMTEVSLIETKSAKNDAEDNFFSRGSWLSVDNDIKGTYSCGPNGTWVTDTKGDPSNKFNMFAYSGATLNVDESQASHFNNYESFITHRLVSNFASGEGAENYNFPTNGIISSKFLGSDVLNEALAKYKTGEAKDGVPNQYKFEGKQLANDIWRTGTMFSSITGLVGSAQITIHKTDANMLQIKIFNITSLTSGDLWKAIDKKNDQSNWPKSYARDPEKITPYGNISQTYNLLIPNPNK